MKTLFIYLAFLASIASVCDAQTIVFTDVNFKNKLLQANELNNIAGTGWENGIPAGIVKIDTNNDGEIQQSEALVITYLNLGGSSISNLSGLEHFINLKWLSITLNSITSFNFTGLVYLESFGCYGNQIQTLDLSSYTNLKSLDCRYNQISTLNFSGLLNLKRVYCSHNLLTSLDFSGNPLFEDLGCSHNNLTNIKIKNGRMHLFGIATLYNECWSHNPNLTFICADDDEINNLQSHLASCNINQPITIDSSCQLSIDRNTITKTNLYPNPTNGVFTIELTNALIEKTEIKVISIIGEVIYTLSNAIGRVHQIDISNYAKGIYFVYIDNKDINEIVKFIKK